jgi:hypothetical protein
MTRNVKTENEYQNIHADCKILHENDIGAVVIVKGGKSSKIHSLI